MLPQKGYLLLRCVALSGCLALLIVEMPLQLPCFVFKAHPACSTHSENGETKTRTWRRFQHKISPRMWVHNICFYIHICCNTYIYIDINMWICTFTFYIHENIIYVHTVALPATSAFQDFKARNRWNRGQFCFSSVFMCFPMACRVLVRRSTCDFEPRQVHHVAYCHAKETSKILHRTSARLKTAHAPANWEIFWINCFATLGHADIVLTSENTCSFECNRMRMHDILQQLLPWVAHCFPTKSERQA